MPAPALRSGSRNRESILARAWADPGRAWPDVFLTAQSCNVVKILHGNFFQKRYTFSHQDPGCQSQVPVSLENPKNWPLICLVSVVQQSLRLDACKPKACNWVREGAEQHKKLG